MQKETSDFILRDLKKAYLTIAEEFDNTRKHDWNEFSNIIPYLKENVKIADIGCGNGRFLSFLKKIDFLFKYTGIDNNEKFINICREKYKEKFIIGDHLDIPIETKSQDIVVSIASLHHIPSIKLKLKAIEELNRILKQDGILFLSVWNLFQKKYKKYIIKAFFRYIFSFGKYDARDTFIPWGKKKILRYYYAFKTKELEKMLKEKNFSIIKKETGNNITFICKKN